MLGRRLIVCFLILLNLFFLYRLLLSDQGVFTYFELREKYDDLSGRTQAANDRSLNLSNEIRWLKSDEVYQERIVRTHMNYLGKNETLYRFRRNKAAQGEVVGKEGSDEKQN